MHAATSSIICTVGRRVPWVTSTLRHYRRGLSRIDVASWKPANDALIGKVANNMTTVSPSDLRPHEDLNGGGSGEKLAEKIRKEGWFRWPIMTIRESNGAQDRNGCHIDYHRTARDGYPHLTADGHHRLSASGPLGLKQLPIVGVDPREVTVNSWPATIQIEDTSYDDLHRCGFRLVPPFQMDFGLNYRGKSYAFTGDDPNADIASRFWAFHQAIARLTCGKPHIMTCGSSSSAAALALQTPGCAQMIQPRLTVDNILGANGVFPPKVTRCDVGIPRPVCRIPLAALTQDTPIDLRQLIGPQAYSNEEPVEVDGNLYGPNELLVFAKSPTDISDVLFGLPGSPKISTTHGVTLPGSPQETILFHPGIHPEGPKMAEAAGYRAEIGETPTNPGSTVGVVARSKPVELPEEAQGAGRAGKGVDNFDLDGARQNGVPVFNSATGNSPDVAELTLWGALAALRKTATASAFIQTFAADNQGQSPTDFKKAYEKRKGEFTGRRLAGQSWSIVGTGAIPQHLVPMLHGFGVNPTLWAREDSIDQKQGQFGVSHLTSDFAKVAKSEIISLHLPKAGEGYLAQLADQLRGKSEPTILIDMGRGVPDSVLVPLLEANPNIHLVTDFPTPNLHRFMQSGQVTALPHLGANTVEATEDAVVQCVAPMITYLKTGMITGSVNMPEFDVEPSRPHRTTIWIDGGTPEHSPSPSPSLLGDPTATVSRVDSDTGSYIVIDSDAALDPETIKQEYPGGVIRQLKIKTN